METLNIDVKKYKTKGHYKTASPKTQIVIASSLRGGNNHIIRLQHKEFGETKKWPMFTITREGNVYQHFSPKYHSDFLNIKKVDKNIITIMLENMVHLYKVDGNYFNHLNEPCNADLVIRKKWLDFEFWEMYSDEQMNSLSELCFLLCEEHSIPKRVIDFHHHHEDISKYKGIVLRGNHIKYCTDNNPTFNLGHIKDYLKNKVSKEE